MGIFSNLRKWAQGTSKQRHLSPWLGGPKPDTAGHTGTQSQRLLSTDEVEAFVYAGEPLTVVSSNVGPLAQYFIDEQKLMLEFDGGASAYLYDDVTPDEAFAFAAAPSKGIWVWDNLRVRGTTNRHRKKFTKLR